MLTILIRTAMAAGSVLSFGRAWHLDIRKLQPDMHLRMQLSIMQTRECMVKFSHLRFRVRRLQKVTVKKLIDIGLSYIPEDCAVARAIRKNCRMLP